MTTATLIKGNGVIATAAATARHPWLHRVVCVRRLLNIPSGHGYRWCPGCASPADHAEQRCIREALAQGRDPTGATMLLRHWHMCESCAMVVEAFDIRVIYLEAPRC